ncbi:MAG: formylglycine-generating enzyme family protein [Desulfovibrionaceae bacterium]
MMKALLALPVLVALLLWPDLGLGYLEPGFILPGEEQPASSPSAPPAPSPSASRQGDTWTEPITGMEFVWVPGGCFQMGSENGAEDEKPVHEVCVDGFWMGKCEVTNAQYRVFRSVHDSGAYEGHSLNGQDQPVVNVSWDDARGYAAWLSNKGNGRFRLPTEAEWEYAARSGGKAERFAGGQDVNRLAWYARNSDSRTHPVGRKTPNGLGLYDMSGNVYEWCQDRHSSGYYASSPRENPPGPSEGSGNMCRGGSWFDGPWYLRSTSRTPATPLTAGELIGFRLLRTN